MLLNWLKSISSLFHVETSFVWLLLLIAEIGSSYASLVSDHHSSPSIDNFSTVPKINLSVVTASHVKAKAKTKAREKQIDMEVAAELILHK